MIAKVVVENGTKKLVPLASGAQIGSGLPLGAIIPVYSNVCPSDYLPCNGVAFDENQYPALYQLLGDNHTPDLRECTLKMIGESGRTVGAHVKSGGLAIGEFIDDRLKVFKDGNGNTYGGARSCATGANGLVICNSSEASVALSGTGATTEVKAVGINYVIKATSGLETGQQEYVLQALNEAGSYSTQEVATGKKWIDGKPIYRKVVDCGALPNATTKAVAHNISNLGQVITIKGIAKRLSDGAYFPIPWTSTYATFNYNYTIYITQTEVIVGTLTDRTSETAIAIIEYTKTTS